MGVPTNLEELLLFHIRDRGIPEPVTEHQFHPTRKWRFDFAWPGRQLAAEVEGGTWGGGSRHTSGAGYQGDCEKYNSAAVMGWMVLRYTGDMVRDGTAIRQIVEIMESEQ